jgi:hypothetical protein
VVGIFNLYFFPFGAFPELGLQGISTPIAIVMIWGDYDIKQKVKSNVKQGSKYG